MLPAATEIVGALGLMDQLVAVSHEYDFPPEADTKPRVTHCESYGKGLLPAKIDCWVSERLRAIVRLGRRPGGGPPVPSEDTEPGTSIPR